MPAEVAPPQRRRIAVIGAGTMGAGIAYVAAVSGYEVALSDTSASSLAAAEARIDEMFTRGIQQGRIAEADGAAARGRLSCHPSLEAAARDAELVIEAVPERIELKRALFTAAQSVAAPHAILASNTSSLPIAMIAAGVSQPERVVGLHFFNPVPAMRLVEIVRGPATSDTTVAEMQSFAQSLGKTAIVVQDSPGFAASRLGIVLGLEAIRMLEQGVASAEDIDRAMELGYNHPMGPLRLGDVVGLDVRLAIADHLHATLHDDTYRAPELLRRMVADGNLGRKSGQGFYRWTAE